MATVVNVRRERADVYIGRGGRWGNPFPIGPGASRAQVIAKYRERLHAQVRSGEVTLGDLAALNGKTLGCYCAPQACHGDVLVRAAAWAQAQLDQQ